MKKKTAEFQADKKPQDAKTSHTSKPNSYSDLKTFQRNYTKKNFPAVILIFYNPDKVDINDFSDVVKKNLNIPENDVFLYVGKDINLNTFIDDYNTLPLFTADRLFIIKDIQDCKQKGQLNTVDALYKILDEPQEQTYIVITHTIVSQKKITKFLAGLLERSEVVNAKEPNPADWIKEYAAAAGKAIEPAAINSLIVLCNGKMRFIKQELDKLFLYLLNEKVIDEKAVKKLVQVYNEDDIFRFLGSLTIMNYSAAVKQYRELIARKESLIPMIYNFTDRISKLIFFIEAASKFSKLYDYRPVADLVFKERKILINYYEGLEFIKIYKNISEERLGYILKILIEMDEISKSREPIFVETAFEIFILKFCCG